VVQVTGGLTIKWNNSSDPVAMVSLFSIGGINKDNNATVSSLVSDVLESKLGVKSNRYYMFFSDAVGHNVGHNGSTF
jgi:hypothetical protein